MVPAGRFASYARTLGDFRAIYAGGQVNARWDHRLLLCSPVWLLLLGSCDDGGCGGSGGASDVCPPPSYGYAVVRGQALWSDGSPIAGKQAYVGCGDAVGAYNDRTDDQGRFEVRPVYAVADTVLYPFPPRNADGSFDLSCQANLQVAHDLILRRDPLLVRFAPTLESVTPTTTELREGVP
jgi:hypothetical protein